MRIGNLLLVGIMSVILSSCYSLPSPEQQKTARMKEGFSSDYRMAVTAMQAKLDSKSSSYGQTGLIPALFRELDEKIANTRVTAQGLAPIDKLDMLLHDYAVSKLNVHASILKRSSYGANDLLSGNDDEVNIFKAMTAAKNQGYDGLMFLHVEPALNPRGVGGSAGFILALNSRIVLRSLKNNSLLLNHLEKTPCIEFEYDEKGQLKYPGLLKGEELPQALYKCYDIVYNGLPAVLDRQLSGN